MHWFNVRCLIPGYAVHVGIVLSYIKWWAQFLFKGWVLRAEKCWIRIFTQATTPLSIKRSHLQTLMNVSRATRGSVPWPRTLWQAGWSRDWSTELLISRRPAPQTPPSYPLCPQPYTRFNEVLETILRFWSTLTQQHHVSLPFHHIRWAETWWAWRSSECSELIFIFKTPDWDDPSLVTRLLPAG